MRAPAFSAELAARAGPSRAAAARVTVAPTSIKVALVLAAGALLGLGSTAWILKRKVDIAAVKVGPWTIWPKSGTSDIDPYARAIYAQSGQIALPSAEGVLLTADVDDAGAPLTGRCTYRISGEVPNARIWTLTATTPAGAPIENPAGRYGFTSAELLRRSNGSFTVDAARSVRPGNWLPTSGADRFTLSLRLYDSPLGNASAQLEPSAVPSIRKEDCS